MGLSAFNNIDMLLLSFLSSIFTHALLCMPSWADAHRLLHDLQGIIGQAVHSGKPCMRTRHQPKDFNAT